MNTVDKYEKTEQLVYKEVGNIVFSWLKDNGYDTWIPRQWGQPTMQVLKSDSVYLNFTAGRRYGWVSTKSKWDDSESKGYTKISWNRDLHITFTFFKSHAPVGEGVGSEYISAEDVARNLLMWIQSSLGVDEFSKNGYFMLQTSEINNPQIVLGTDQFDRTPNFEIIFVVKEYTVFDTTDNFILYENQKNAFLDDSTSNTVIGMTATQKIK